jgi:hypothetical protein
MNTQHAIECIAAAIVEGMTADEARTINAADGFTVDHGADDSGSFIRTKGVTVSAADMEKAIQMAQTGDFPWE